MIGWINLSIERFITKAFGEDAWNKVVAESGVTDCGWVSSCPYPDKITYDLVITAARVLGVTVDQALEAYGGFFVDYVTEQGYTKLLQTLGSDIVEFLANLNNLHLHLSNGQPAMDAPAFRVTNVTATSCHLHYYSKRPALWPIVVGVLKGMSKEYLKFDLGIKLLSSRDQGHDHETFLIEYPPQAHVQVHNEADISKQHIGFTLTADGFASLHPFHVLMDTKCCLMQFGQALNKLVPGIAAGIPLKDLFVLRHPLTDLTWEAIQEHTNSSFVLQVPSSGLELKGQMIPTTMPVPGCPVPRPVLLFMCSPRCANLDDMLKHGLYLSDIPLHDLSRDFVLLAEQRQAEADLKETFEKLTLELKAEKARSDALVQRMSGLLACFPFKGKGADKQAAAQAVTDSSVINKALTEADETFGRMEVIEAVRRTLNTMNLKQSEESHIQILSSIGEGTYGKVYRGLWQGTDVAIKTIVLPADMSGAQKREKMALMEAAISSSLSHPNIVQTYTYAIHPLKDGGLNKLNSKGDLMATEHGNSSKADSSNGTSSPSKYGTLGDGVRGAGVTSYEVRMVLELCDRGSLRDVLEQHAFMVTDPSTGEQLLNYAGVLDIAMDVAKAFIHLHRNNLLHSDLKARNVLLRGGGGNGVGVTAKVSDFGLAVKLLPDTEYVDGMFQGTLTHMAPEVLTEGRVSKASDVYAFGITLWELYTGDHVFKGVPRTILGHQVSEEHRRPEFPASVPPKYKQLAQWCWNKDTNIRPTFEEILAMLLAMRRELGGTTPAIRNLNPNGVSSDGQSSTQEAEYHQTEAGTMTVQGTKQTTSMISARLPQLPSQHLDNSVSFLPESDSDDFDDDSD